MRISVIIPVWNLWEMTASCLRSLAGCSPGMDMQVVVVDNGSSDSTADQLASLGHSLWGKDFLPVRLPENMGFAKACNTGARAADSDLLFFVNNDITFTEDWLPPLLAVLGKAGTGAVGPLLLFPDGRCQHCGVSFSPLRKSLHLYSHFPGNHPALRSTHPLQAITGAAILLRKETFFTAGAFYEGYQNGYEDLDLCFSLARHGLKCRMAPSSVLYHHTSQTPGRFKKDEDNAALFSQRWGRQVQADLHLQAAVDGYETRISPRCAVYLTLSEQREKELTASALSHDTDDLLNLLEEEPLWLNGYLHAARMLSQKGEQAAAIELMCRAIRFFPIPKAQTCLLHLAREAGLEELPDILRLELAPDAELMEQNRKRIQFLKREAAKNGQHRLEHILACWLEENVRLLF
ncbi:MAG: glycosyltransferase family 2 protein [Desulfovibrio sp.]|nr:glycosyltransferase family 2 protein [Desulfovibrio sp.]